MPFEDNLLQMLRMQNIFGPARTDPNVIVPGGGIPGATTPTFTGQDIRTTPMQQPAMNQIYQPETRATDQMYKLLESIPQRNKPGKLRKVAASMAGIAGGPEASNDFLYRPYHEQMQDFNARFKPTMDVAQQERLQNVNMRQLADSIINRNIQDRRADTYQQSIDNQTRNAETNRIRAESYAKLNEFKMNPANFDMKIEAPRGGNYTLIDPKGIKPPIDTGIPTGTLDRMQEINLQIEGQKEVAAIPRTVYGSSTTSTVTPPEAEQPTQAKQRMINNANKFINENPEFAEVIEFDPDTELPRVKPLGTRISGNRLLALLGKDTIKTLTQEDINKINDAINTGKPLEAARVSTTNRQTTSTRGGTVPNAANPIPDKPIKPGDAGPAPAANNQRIRAVEELRKIGITNPNERQIQEAIKDLGL